MINLRLVVAWIFKLLMWTGIAFIAWTVFSCEEFCEEPNRTAVVVNFYSATNVVLNTKTLMIRGVENDSLLDATQYFPQKEYLQVTLPVNPTSDFMSFSIKNDTLPADTLIIHYIRHNGFISPQCGCAAYAEIQKVEMRETPEGTYYTIKNFTTVNPNVTTVSYRQGLIHAENISIHY